MFAATRELAGRGSEAEKDNYLRQVKATELGLKYAELDQKERHFVNQLADNERDRQNALQKAVLEGDNAKELAALNHEFRLKEAQIKQQFDTELEGVKTQNKLTTDNNEARVKTLSNKGYLPDQEDQYKSYQTPQLNFRGQFEQNNPKMLEDSYEAELYKQGYDNDLKAAQAKKAASDAVLKFGDPNNPRYLDPDYIPQGTSAGLDENGKFSFTNPMTNNPYRAKGPTAPTVQPSSHEPPALSLNPWTTLKGIGGAIGNRFSNSEVGSNILSGAGNAINGAMEVGRDLATPAVLEIDRWRLSPEEFRRKHPGEVQ